MLSTAKHASLLDSVPGDENHRRGRKHRYSVARDRGLSCVRPVSPVGMTVRSICEPPSHPTQPRWRDTSSVLVRRWLCFRVMHFACGSMMPPRRARKQRGCDLLVRKCCLDVSSLSQWICSFSLLVNVSTGGGTPLQLPRLFRGAGRRPSCARWAVRRLEQWMEEEKRK